MVRNDTCIKYMPNITSIKQIKYKHCMYVCKCFYINSSPGWKIIKLTTLFKSLSTEINDEWAIIHHIIFEKQKNYMHILKLSLHIRFTAGQTAALALTATVVDKETSCEIISSAVRCYSRQANGKRIYQYLHCMDKGFGTSDHYTNRNCNGIAF